MTQRAIPYIFMRGGTSRGPYFNAADLPEDRDALTAVLIDVIGAGHPQNINGIGGGVAVTTKVAILSPSPDGDREIDYFFAQVSPDRYEVDFKPTCGNMLTGVGPAAIEMGLVPGQAPSTTVRIRAVNTGASVDALVETPNGVPRYDGNMAIDGVPGTAAPVRLLFRGIEGSVTAGLFPTGAHRQTIDGIEVTCIDAAMPLVIARAADFGLTGYETAAELDENAGFYARMEPLRQRAGAAMGMGDVSQSVVPKFALLAAPRADGMVTARYFMPRRCHPSMAVTGAQCIAACCLAPDTVAEPLELQPPATGAPVIIEHPAGQIEVLMDYDVSGDDLTINSAGLVRTARKLADGRVFVPG